MAGSSTSDALLRSLRYSYRCVVAAVGAACRPGGAARCAAAAAAGQAPALLSRVVDDAAAGRVDRVLIGAETLEVWGADAKLYDAAMVPWLDVSWLAERLGSHGVGFGASLVEVRLRVRRRAAMRTQHSRAARWAARAAAPTASPQRASPTQILLLGIAAAQPRPLAA